MNIIFFGNADFGSETLLSLIDSNNHNVQAIVVSKSKRQSRKKKHNPIKSIALKYRIKLYEQDDLNDTTFIDKLKKINSDVFIVIAFKIIPKEIFSIPKFGTINLHASLLPRYRGAAPIQKAIINGDGETGLSTFFINDKIDRGKIIHQKKVKISKSDTFHDLWKKLSKKGPMVLKKTLELIAKNEVDILNHEIIEPSYAPKIKKNDLLIKWNIDNAVKIHNKIRAFSPSPCMYTFFGKMRIKILKSKVVEENFKKKFPPGYIFVDKNHLYVNCIDKLLRIDSLFPESKKQIESAEFINGYYEDIISIKNFG